MTPADPHMIEQALDLPEGATMTFEHLPYSLLRYEDSMVALWKEPTTGKLGREFFGPDDLEAFMKGDDNKGSALIAPSID